MKDFKYKGFTYTKYIRSWKNGKKKYEIIRYKNGFRNLWERINLTTYNDIIIEKFGKTI